MGHATSGTDRASTRLAWSQGQHVSVLILLSASCRYAYPLWQELVRQVIQSLLPW